MSFRYDVLNLEVLDHAKAVFAKPSTQWTADEHNKAVLIIEAMRVVASQCKALESRNEAQLTDNKKEK